MNVNREKHWETVYETKNPSQVSWTQKIPKTSLEFIRSFGLEKSAKIIDIGGGDSHLVDYLLDDGFENVSVLDISSKALEKAKARLGERANQVNWIVSDITEFQPNMNFDVWHDRATFHFLTKSEEIEKYLETARITNFILVRHAETTGGGSEPVLSAEGMERAERLAGILSELDIDRVYSTNYNRTMDTAQPTADNKGLEITNYGGFDQQAVINDILENVNGGKVLIVGHSNTTPNFLNVLTGTSDYPNLPEGAYDNLFIVNVKSKGDSEVINLKY